MLLWALQGTYNSDPQARLITKPTGTTKKVLLRRPYAYEYEDENSNLDSECARRCPLSPAKHGTSSESLHGASRCLTADLREEASHHQGGGDATGRHAAGPLRVPRAGLPARVSMHFVASLPD
jgi:hypothetical protein